VVGSETGDDSRWLFPLVGTLGAPGTGKTAFVDQLAKILSSLKEQRLAVTASFNSYTHISRQNWTNVSLSARVLFSFYFDSENPAADWSKFSEVPGVTKLTLNLVLHAMQEITTAERIVLFVDEIAKSLDFASEILGELTTQMDSFRLPADRKTASRLSVFVTSLDGVFGQIDFTGSGRILTNCDNYL